MQRMLGNISFECNIIPEYVRHNLNLIKYTMTVLVRPWLKAEIGKVCRVLLII